MEHEIQSPTELLGPDGRLSSEGYATLPRWRYRRNRIKAPWYRIKEWDYYAVIDQATGFGLTLTASDLGYAGLYALCLVDLKAGTAHQVDTMRLLPAGRGGFAETADEEHTVAFVDSTLSITLDRSTEERRLAFSCDSFEWEGERGLEGEILLRQDASQERMVIATSWAEKRTAFYYNQKINCMPAEGYVVAGGRKHLFRTDTSFGVLDWGRGNWTYRNRWFWGSASGLHQGVPFGFNLGYGFSDRSPASENMLFFDGAAHKLDRVEFHFDESDYLKPWRVSSNDKRLELIFSPTVDRFSRTDLGLIKSVQHQCFGFFSGTARLDDGTELKLTDFPGFAEDVYNRW